MNVSKSDYVDVVRRHLAVNAYVDDSVVDSDARDYFVC
jgi:hypothetical protein